MDGTAGFSSLLMVLQDPNESPHISLEISEALPLKPGVHSLCCYHQSELIKQMKDTTSNTK